VGRKTLFKSSLELEEKLLVQKFNSERKKSV
jgi:hypothetical protein